MALLINELCINCDVCEPACPNQAISMGPSIYEIAFDRCTECVGHFDEPQCVVVCPVECIDIDVRQPESRDELLLKYQRLTQAAADVVARAQEGVFAPVPAMIESET